MYNSASTSGKSNIVNTLSEGAPNTDDLELPLRGIMTDLPAFLGVLLLLLRGEKLLLGIKLP